MEKMTNLTIDDYMMMPYRIEVYEDRCGESVCYMAYNPELEGCMAQGDTPYDAVNQLKEARRLYISTLLKRNLAVPIPSDYSEQPIEFKVVPMSNAAPAKGIEYMLAA
ncbi:MAG TPA: type II toxin-antitoxin system HicB family antitoxin [Chthonomonadaceae bacterium]|nr:type II toxin-antitoxin system HicB family antitoxin [Chthonomonadaceae bacterium]